MRRFLLPLHAIFHASARKTSHKMSIVSKVNKNRRIRKKKISLYRSPTYTILNRFFLGDFWLLKILVLTFSNFSVYVLFNSVYKQFRIILPCNSCQKKFQKCSRYFGFISARAATFSKCIFVLHPGKYLYPQICAEKSLISSITFHII